MSKFALLSTLLLVSLPVKAKPYTVTKTGSRWAISPSAFTVQIKPWAQEPKPDCNGLFRSLATNSALIDRCLPTGSQPATACNLLKKNLPVIIFGTDNPGGSLADDAEQFFEVQSASSEALPSLAQIARDERLPVARLTMGTDNPWQQSISKIAVSVEAGSTSWIAKLAQLDYLKDFIGKISVGVDHSFGVRDRVTFCEIAGGQSTLAGDVSYRAVLGAEVSEVYLDWIQRLYDSLKALKYPLPGTADQQALTVGFEMGNFAIENPLPQGLEFDALETYKMFFQKTGEQLTMISLGRQEMKAALSKKIDFQTSAKFQTSTVGE